MRSAPTSSRRCCGARKLPVPRQVLRYAAQVTWRLRLQPSSIGWVDMALNVPLLDSGRARTELGWAPRRAGSTRSATRSPG